MATSLRIRRRVSGAAGAPASLLTGELAYNMSDGTFYAGKGDNGSGVATSVVAFAADDFINNIPTGGTTGQVLAKNSNTAGDVGWVTAEGATYTASGDGIELTGTQFALNYAEIAGATGLNLAATYAPISHTHAAADITSGTFDAARIPSLDASKIATGTIDIARLPVLPSSVQVVSTGGIAALDAGQQAEIGDGSIVTTTDGRRWVYSGTGSKTAEASYIELADITPTWSVIADKPVFATVATSGLYSDLSGAPALHAVATSGDYNDLTNKPALGTMAAQNANAVAITGGTIDGVTLDGGTF